MIAIVTNWYFWLALLGVGVVLLVIGKKMDLLNNTAYATIVSIVIALAYFHIVDDQLMDLQGLDYWYLFRK